MAALEICLRTLTPLWTGGVEQTCDRLHETGLIAPHSRQNGERTKLGGWVFLDEQAQKTFGDETRWRQWLGELQVGGERRYGFGKLRMEEFEAARAMNKYETDLAGDRPRLMVPQQQPLLAHTLTTNVDANGQIEPLVGRETDPANSARFGHMLTAGLVCWAPGSVMEKEQWFEVDEMGLWGQEEPIPRP